MLKLPNLEIKKITEGETEIVGELPAVDFDSFRSAAIKNLGQTIKVDGFRPGHTPEEILVSQIGEARILQEMAERALAEIYPLILKEHKLDALGRPEITLTKLAAGNPLGFKIKTALRPEVELGDYQTIAKKLNANPTKDIIIDDEAVSKVLEDLRRSRENVDHSHHEHKEGEKCETEEKKIELNDDFAKSLGQFETLEELKTKIKANLEAEEQLKQKDKKRVEVIEEIIKASKLEIAPLLIASEKEKMLAEMEGQIGQMGLKFDDYLTHLKKTREDLKNAWDKEARQRVAFGLILEAIANQEKIQAPAEELKNEVDYLKLQYKDVDEERLRSYARGLIVNEKVFEYLANLK